MIWAIRVLLRTRFAVPLASFQRRQAGYPLPRIRRSTSGNGSDVNGAVSANPVTDVAFMFRLPPVGDRR